MQLHTLCYVRASLCLFQTPTFSLTCLHNEGYLASVQPLQQEIRSTLQIKGSARLHKNYSMERTTSEEISCLRQQGNYLPSILCSLYIIKSYLLHSVSSKYIPFPSGLSHKRHCSLDSVPQQCKVFGLD